jgi:hypothetical protein
LRELTILLLSLPLCGQELRVLSEFRRIDSTGVILAADRGGTPREILSPAVPRNAFSSFRIVIMQPAGTEVWLDIGQNPENAVDVTLYEESADGRLRKAAVPYRSKMPPGATATPIWMDVWVRRNAPVQRIKLEPQLYFDGRWYTYPMEVRIIEPVVPPIVSAVSVPWDPALPADSAARQIFKTRYCGAHPANTDAPLRVGDLIARNAFQDHELLGKTSGEPLLLTASGAPSIEIWCKAPPPTPDGPEWYLRFRDLVYRHASRR